MSFLAVQIGKLEQAGAALLSPGSILSLPQLAVALTLALAFLSLCHVMRRGRLRPAAILRALKIRRILLHRSTRADLLYYVVNTFASSALIGWGIVSSAVVAGLTDHVLRAAFGPQLSANAPDWALRLAITLIVFLAYEFGYYVDHWLKHRIPVLWEFHKTHHTAEVLTPLTVFRVHPIDTLIFADIVAVTIGISQGLFVYAAGKTVDLYLIDNANAITVVCLFLLAQLQHSQFWIPLRGLAGCLILSPAHHQIHHSTDPAHYNRNLGSFVAIFDWAFGTLALPPKTAPRLVFGAESKKDPHRIDALLLDPIVTTLKHLRPRRASAPSATLPAE